MDTKVTVVDVERRKLFTKGLAAAAAWGVLAPHRTALASMCLPTPAQVEGPFYPVAHALDEDTDLTRIEGGTGSAAGQLAYVRGRVIDERCAPIERALVEIWQACTTGRYNHPADDNPAPFDPNFQGWGRAVTDADGYYVFRTIVPGAYPNDPTWMRPPHIHFKVNRRGFLELTTQMYFAGNRYNADDKILRRLSPEEQARVVITGEAPGADFEAYAQVYTFDLALQRP